MARITESLQLNLGTNFGRASTKARQAIRSAASSGSDLDIDLAGSATVNAQLWLNRFPLRPTAGWAVLAALLSVGLLNSPLSIEWGGLILLWLLADPLWGAIWRLAGGRTEILPLRERDLNQAVWLPYFEPGSPAALLLGADKQGVLHLVFRVAAPTVALAAAIALVLGPTAVWITAALLAVSMLGWIFRHTFGVVPASLHSAVTIALPWFLAFSFLGVDATHESWRLLVVFVLLWFLHNWGELRVLRASPDVIGIGLLAIADLGIVLLLVTARQPIWLALVVILWLPTWLAIYRGRPMISLNFWWLAAMLVSAAAVGQSVSF